MMQKSLSEVSIVDLQALIESGVSESKTIEYKRDLPRSADSDTVPFVEAVSSFANTSGGDLLIGVEERAGLPTGFPGVEIANIDAEKLRLEQILASGLEPRLPRIELHLIKVSEGRYVIVVRVPRSWVAPHRVKRNHKFCGRNAAGKYPLDVGELRAAFMLSESVAERIRNFRAVRIARVYGRETPVALPPGGCLILHVVPLGAFTNSAIGVDMEAYFERHSLAPLGGSTTYRLYNLDGVVTATGPHEEGAASAYAQLFRTGVAEHVAVPFLCQNGTKYLGIGYERYVVDAVEKYLRLSKELGVEPPFYVFLSFVDVRGYWLAMDDHASWLWKEHARPLREDTMLLPEVVLEDAARDPQRSLLRLFNQVANAFGLPRSPNRAKD